MAFEEGPFSRVSAAGEVVEIDGKLTIFAGQVSGPYETCEGGEDTCTPPTAEQKKGYSVFLFIGGVDIIAYDKANCEPVKNERGYPKIIEEWDNSWDRDLGFAPFTRVERYVGTDEQPAGEGLCNKNNPGGVNFFLRASEHDGLCCTGDPYFQVNVKYVPLTHEGTNSFGERTGTIAKPINVNFDSAPGNYMNGVWQLVELINYVKKDFRIVVYDSLWRKVGGVETRWPSF